MMTSWSMCPSSEAKARCLCRDLRAFIRKTTTCCSWEFHFPACYNNWEKINEMSSFFSLHLTSPSFHFICKYPTAPLHCFPSLRTSEDECGNRNREVLGQSLGAAGWMHWAVVGRAASMGKGRPGPISTQKEREKEKEREGENEDGGPVWKRVRNVPTPNVSIGRKKEMHTNTKTTYYCRRLKKQTQSKIRAKRGTFFSPSHFLSCCTIQSWKATRNSCTAFSLRSLLQTKKNHQKTKLARKKF